MFVKVALAIEAKDGGMGYYYHVEDSLSLNLSLGKRVVVPFGKDEVVGYIIEIKASLQADYKIKAILGFVDKETYLSPCLTKPRLRRLTVNRDASALYLRESQNRLKQGCFSGAVFTDQTVNFTLSDR